MNNQPKITSEITSNEVKHILSDKDFESFRIKHNKLVYNATQIYSSPANRSKYILNYFKFTKEKYNDNYQNIDILLNYNSKINFIKNLIDVIKQIFYRQVEINDENKDEFKEYLNYYSENFYNEICKTFLTLYKITINRRRARPDINNQPKSKYTLIEKEFSLLFVFGTAYINYNNVLELSLDFTKQKSFLTSNFMFSMLNNPNLVPSYKKAYLNEAYFVYNKFPPTIHGVKERDEFYKKITENIPEFDTSNFVLHLF